MIVDDVHAPFWLISGVLRDEASAILVGMASQLCTNVKYFETFRYSPRSKSAFRDPRVHFLLEVDDLRNVEVRREKPTDGRSATSTGRGSMLCRWASSPPRTLPGR